MHVRLGGLLFAALLLSACASAGPSAPAINSHRSGELVPGSSTKDDAIAKLGAPIRTSAIGNGML
jgi:hypothetical protein